MSFPLVRQYEEEHNGGQFFFLIFFFFPIPFLKGPDRTTTTSAPKPVNCNSQSCKYGATCVNLYTGVLCVCPYGYYYSEGCQLGQIFPGQISLDKQYDPAMANEQSKEYLEVYTSVTNFFYETLKGEASYKETSITSINFVQLAVKYTIKVSKKY
nr:mucin-13-like [Anolis sagrei ordinatus]